MATQSELYTLALSVGLSPENAKTAAAVAMAESDGNANAHNTNVITGDNSYGYWQINMLGDLGPDRRRKYGLSSNEQLFDPATNARVMKGESNNGTNWFPWSAYKSGSYLKFLNISVDDQSSDPSWLQRLGKTLALPVTGPIDVAQNLGSIVETVNKTAAWVSNSRNWLRVAYVAGGGIAVIVGLVMVAGSTPAGRAAANLIPAGKVAKVAKKLK